MKKIYLWVLVSILFVSCSTDEKVSESLDTSIMMYFRTSEVDPSNPYNSQDSVGIVFSELLDLYYGTEVKPESLDSLLLYLGSLSDAHHTFSQFKTSNYEVPTSLYVTSLLQYPTLSLSSSITHSGLSAPAQTSLTEFVSDLLQLCVVEDDYAVIYEVIVSYEAFVSREVSFTSYDQQFLLVTTSVLRHATHAKKKRPKKNTDPEWDLMVGNFTGVIEGAGMDKASAIFYALAVGIAENDF